MRSRANGVMQRRIDGIRVSVVSNTTTDHGTDSFVPGSWIELPATVGREGVGPGLAITGAELEPLSAATYGEMDDSAGEVSDSVDARPDVAESPCALTATVSATKIETTTPNLRTARRILTRIPPECR